MSEASCLLDGPVLTHRTIDLIPLKVLRPGDVLELMLKCGDGVITVFDGDYGTERFAKASSRDYRGLTTVELRESQRDFLGRYHV